MSARRPFSMIAKMSLAFALLVGVVGALVHASSANATAGPRTADAVEIALTHRGDSWWISATAIELRSPTGDISATMRTDAAGLGSIAHFAVSPHDASLWVVTDADRLLHVEDDGIRSSASPLPASAVSLALAQNGEVWIATADTVLRYSPEGRPAGAIALEAETGARAVDRDASPKRGDDRADAAWREILVDSLRDRAWIANAQRLTRLGLETPVADVSVDLPTGCAARSAALDALRGSVFVLCEHAVVMLDGSGSEVSRFALDEFEPATFDRLAYDPKSSELTVSGANVALRIGAIERLVFRDSVDPSLGSVHPAPFRIEPTITLLRPPDGGATSDESQEIVLSVGARCPSGTCSAPDGYVADLQVAATVNGIARATPALDTATKRTALSAAGALHAGSNRIDAEVRDRFGHVGRMPAASLTLLTVTDQSGTLPRTPVAKAANKPPTVVLTAPLAGSVFTTGGDITLSATASDSDGSIARVEFYRAGSALIGTATAPPYAVVWPKAVAGSHSLTARAFDNRKSSTTSAPVTISVVDNKPPSVSVTRPAEGAFVTAGSPVTLEADPRDADGSIARLEFFDGTTSLVVLSASPWTWTWSSPAAGHHSITARATDDRGAIATSAVANMTVGAPPRVVISVPAPCTVADAPIDLWVTVDVYSASDTITSVELFDGSTPLYGLLQPPWRFLIANASVGTRSITARATDAHGLTTTSRPAQIEVRAANQPPAVAVTAPAEAATLPFGVPVTLTADATDPDGTIASVRFQTSAGYMIGTATQAPYRVTWTGVTAGAYTVFAYATDDRGAITTSAPAHFSVATNFPPVVSLTAPSGGATYGAPATISLAASASDPDGAIARVEFYSGTTLLGTDTSEPYTYQWSGVSAGAYSLSARAYDSSGAMTTSAAVAVTVVPNAPPTVTLAAPAAGIDYYAPATVDLTATASDSDGSVVRVEFRAEGTLIGTATATPYAVVWESVPAGTYSITATAYDERGSTATSTPVSLVVKPPVGLNLIELADGATIDDDRMRIRGSFAGPDNSSITINGMVAHLDDRGFFQLNDVPLVPGVNTIDAVVTTQDGQTASRAVTVNSSGPGPFVVDASPTEGIGSLTVTFTTANRAGSSFKQISFDLDGDGYPNVIATPAEFADGPFSFTATYPVGTWNVVIKAFDDEDRVVYETQKSIVVLMPTLYGNRIRAVYEQMLTRLGAGNTAGALTAFTASAYEKYAGIFSQLQPDLATLVGQVGTLAGMTFGMDIAELNVVRDTPEGPQQFMVYLIRSEDGIWRIDGM